MASTSSRAGFTAPELLNMLVVGAILAVIIYGQRRAHRGPAPDPAIAPLHAALVELKDAEARYHARARTYTVQVDSLGIAPAAGITRAVDRADSATWHAIATKEGSRASCEVTVGVAATADSIVCRTAAP
jgi:Tfp pilus assembly protein PilE